MEGLGAAAGHERRGPHGDAARLDLLAVGDYALGATADQRPAAQPVGHRGQSAVGLVEVVAAREDDDQIRGRSAQSQGRAVASYMHKVRGGGNAPEIAGETRTAILVFGRWCGNCHIIDGEGVKQGPDLTRAGEKRDAKWLREWITDPESIDDLADMPAFEDRLSPEELTAIANYLAARK